MGRAPGHDQCNRAVIAMIFLNSCHISGFSLHKERLFFGAPIPIPVIRASQSFTGFFNYDETCEVVLRVAKSLCTAVSSLGIRVRRSGEKTRPPPNEGGLGSVPRLDQT